MEVQTKLKICPHHGLCKYVTFQLDDDKLQVEICLKCVAQIEAVG